MKALKSKLARHILRDPESARNHFRREVPLNEAQGPNEYDEYIQIADLNALNAALAVIRWKRLMGYYVDLQGEHQSRYTIDGNAIGNEEF